MSDYNKFYKENRYSKGMEPNNLTKEILKFKTRGTVLDLGCGEGQDAIFLTEQGFDVLGIDLSYQAIENLNKVAQDRKIIIDTKVMDITQYNFHKTFDIILSEASLHFLSVEERKEYINKIKLNTNENGLNVLGIFDEDTSKELHDGMKHWGISLFKRGELLGYYSDWEVLNENNYKVKMENGFERSISQIIARKKTT